MQKLLSYARSSLVDGIFKPIIVTDIDGVLLRGTTQIPQTKEALQILRDKKIPLACLTNGAGQLQKLKAKKMNDIFGDNFFSGQLMIMAHTPVKPYLLNYSRKGGYIVISGSLHITDILDDLQISNFVTADQLYTLLHQQSSTPISQVSFYKRPLQKAQVIINLKKRLRINHIDTSYEWWANQISAIFALNDVSPYETTLSVIHNIFKIRQIKGLNPLHYYAAQNDIVWAGGYHRPRLAFGPFNYMLQQHCSRHSLQLTKHYFGKPQKATFQFVKEYLNQKFGYGCFFMVGDNPRADIKGANSVGWASFLTQTGVHHGSQNDKQNSATVVVQNFAKAMHMILQIENTLNKKK